MSVSHYPVFVGYDGRRSAQWILGTAYEHMITYDPERDVVLDSFVTYSGGCREYEVPFVELRHEIRVALLLAVCPD